MMTFLAIVGAFFLLAFIVGAVRGGGYFKAVERYLRDAHGDDTALLVMAQPDVVNLLQAAQRGGMTPVQCARGLLSYYRAEGRL